MKFDLTPKNSNFLNVLFQNTCVNYYHICITSLPRLTVCTLYWKICFKSSTHPTPCLQHHPSGSIFSGAGDGVVIALWLLCGAWWPRLKKIESLLVIRRWKTQYYFTPQWLRIEITTLRSRSIKRRHERRQTLDTRPTSHWKAPQVRN